MSRKLIVQKIALVVLLGVLILAPTEILGAPNPDLKVPEGSCGVDLFCHGIRLINWATVTLAYVISYIGGVLISLAVTIIQVVISAGTNVLTSNMVQVGFKIALDITNLGFVLAIIMIAFTTMLRLQSYDTKQFLKNLIIAAVLVNFSLSIAGVVIDASNVFGNFFINAASPGGLEDKKLERFAENLAGALNVQKILGITPNAADSGTGSFIKFGTAYLTTIASISVALIFNAFLVITFYAVTFMLLLRYLWLVFLIIIMPLAWLAYTFPKLSKYFSEWWENFLHWNIFYPVVAFFLYLGIQSSQSIGALVTGSGQGAAINYNTLSSASKLTGLPADTLAGFLQIFVQVGIMLGGLYAASRLKVAGADAAMKMATGVKDRVLGIAGRATLRATGSPAAATALLKKGGLADKFADSITGNRIFGRFAPGIKNAVANRGKFAAEELEKKYKNYSKDAVLAEAQVPTSDTAKMAYLANRVAKDQKIDKLPEAIRQRLFAAAQDKGITGDLEANAPQFAHEYSSYEKVFDEAKKRNPSINSNNFKKDSDEFKQAAIQMAMENFKPGKTDALDAKAIEAVAPYFRKEHLERVSKEGDVSQLFAIAKSAAKLSSTKPEHLLVEFARNNPSMKQLKLDPRYSTELKALKEMDAAEEISKKKKEGEFKVEIKKGPERPTAPGL